MSLAVVLGMGLASAPPAFAEDDGDLVVALGQAPLGAIVRGVWNHTLLAQDGEDWYLSSDSGAQWDSVGADPTVDYGPDVLEYLDADRAVISGSMSEDDDNGDLVTNSSVWVVDTAHPGDVTRYDLPGLDVRAANASTAIAESGSAVHAVDLATKTETTLTTDVAPSDDVWARWTEIGAAEPLRITADANNGYVATKSSIDPTPIDGSSAGSPAFQVIGEVASAAYTTGGIGYAVGKKSTGKSTYEYDYCTRATGASTSTCSVLKSGITWKNFMMSSAGLMGPFVQLQIGEVLYFSVVTPNPSTGKIAAPVKVTGVGPDHYADGSKSKFALMGSSDHPIVSDTTAGTGGIFTVAASGKATRFSVGPTGPVEPDQLSLSASRMAGVDGRGTGTAWQRDLSAPTDEQVISKHGLQARVSVGRTAVNGTDGLILSDQGKQVAKLAKWVDLGEMSGPYLLGQATKKAKKATVLAGTKAVTFGKWDYPMALFGSRVASITWGANWDWWITISDVSTGKPVQVATVPLDAFQDVSSVWMWGDRVLVSGKEDPDADAELVVVTNFVTTQEFTTVFAEGVTVGGLGDGVAVVETPDQDGWQAMSTATGALTPLEDSVDAVPALDGANHVLYATDSKLVVHELPYGGTSAPRALWTSAPSTFNSWAGESAPWKLSVDATKAVDAGSLVITGTGALSGTSVAVPVEASADGALRIAWDGTLDDFTAALPGTYTWKLVGFDFLKDITGASDVDGTLTVTNKAIAFPQATPVIDHTKPVTDTVLTATPGAKPSDATTAYQWYRGTKAIPGATAASYTVTAGDIGKTIKVKVSLSGSTHYLATSKYSASTKKVAKATLTKGSVALDDTTPQVGSPVSAVLDGWGPAPVTATYQWYRVDAKNKATAISKATQASYTPIAADAGYRLKVAATCAKPGYTSASLTSAVSEPTLA